MTDTRMQGQTIKSLHSPLGLTTWTSKRESVSLSLVIQHSTSPPITVDDRQIFCGGFYNNDHSWISDFFPAVLFHGSTTFPS